MNNVIYRNETYGHAVRLNIMHYIFILVTCPETTKVNPAPDNGICATNCCPSIAQ